jgi:hypothetical protein
MSRKLEFGISVEIVHATLKNLFPHTNISLEYPVGEIIPGEADREVLRKSLQERLRAISVHLEMPPIEPHLTVQDIGRDISHWSGVPGAWRIAWSVLPGIPTIPDPGQKTPPPGPVQDDPLGGMRERKSRSTNRRSIARSSFRVDGQPERNRCAP